MGKIWFGLNCMEGALAYFGGIELNSTSPYDVVDNLSYTGSFKK